VVTLDTDTADAAEAGAATATGAPASAPPTTAARSAERRLNPPFSGSVASDSVLSTVRLSEAAVTELVGSTGRLLAGRHGRLVHGSFSGSPRRYPAPELRV
jgi:hypothetical protein